MEQVNVYSIKRYEISGMFLKSGFNLVSLIATPEKRKRAQPNPRQNTKICEIHTAEIMRFSDKRYGMKSSSARQSSLDHSSHWTQPTLETVGDAEKGTEVLQFRKSPLKVSHFTSIQKSVWETVSLLEVFHIISLLFLLTTFVI